MFEGLKEIAFGMFGDLWWKRENAKFAVQDHWGEVHKLTADEINKKVEVDSHLRNYSWELHVDDLVALCQNPEFPDKYAQNIKVALLNRFAKIMDHHVPFDGGGENAYYCYNSLVGESEDICAAKAKYLEALLSGVQVNSKDFTEYSGEIFKKFNEDWIVTKKKELLVPETMNFKAVLAKLSDDYSQSVKVFARVGVFREREYEVVNRGARVGKLALSLIVGSALFFSCNQFGKDMENNAYYNSANDKKTKELVGKIYHGYFDKDYKLSSTDRLNGETHWHEYSGITKPQGNQLIDLFLQNAKDSIDTRLEEFIINHPSILQNATAQQAKGILGLRPTKIFEVEWSEVRTHENYELYGNTYEDTYKCLEPNTLKLHMAFVKKFDTENKEINKMVHEFLEDYGDALSCRGLGRLHLVFRGEKTSLIDAFFGATFAGSGRRGLDVSFMPTKDWLEKIVSDFEKKNGTNFTLTQNSYYTHLLVEEFQSSINAEQIGRLIKACDKPYTSDRYDNNMNFFMNMDECLYNYNSYELNRGDGWDWARACFNFRKVIYRKIDGNENINTIGEVKIGMERDIGSNKITEKDEYLMNVYKVVCEKLKQDWDQKYGVKKALGAR